MSRILPALEGHCPQHYYCFMNMMIEFRPSPIHGMGGFARTAIAAGTPVIEYTGEKIDKLESLKRCTGGNQFIFFLDAEFDIDGGVETNEARWLNHSCDPNCVAELLNGQIWITARRNIRAGEEITFDYGYDLDSFREHPCKCGAANCAGYILGWEFREQAKR
jgi:uncharacterized protein